jgi:hypothetical protein
MIYDTDTPATPSAEIKEALVGFRVGDTAALGLSKLHKVQLLGKSTDLDTITSNVFTICTHILLEEHDPKGTPYPTHRSGGYTSYLDLPGMLDTPFLPLGGVLKLPSAPFPAPTPLL